MKIGRHIQDDIDTPFEIVDKIKIVNVCFCFCLFVFNRKGAIDVDENCPARLQNESWIIQLWGNRDLSIMEQIVILTIWGLSYLICVMHSIGIPYGNRLFHKFIRQKRFSNRKTFEKVKRVTVEEYLAHGKLKMISVVRLRACVRACVCVGWGWGWGAEVLQAYAAILGFKKNYHRFGVISYFLSYSLQQLWNKVSNTI